MAGYVSLQDVTKTYQMGEITIKAADGISFDVEKGEFVIVVGPSGAGKTTVLNILGGMDTATSGKYFDITEKEGDMIAKHMFPLTVTPPKYKETFVIVLVDKFCSFNEVLDDFIHRKFCGAKDTRIKWFGAGKGEKR